MQKNEDMLVYIYRRGHLEGQADLARILREKIRNRKEANPYSLLVELKSELLTLMEEANTRIATMRNQANYGQE